MINSKISNYVSNSTDKDQLLMLVYGKGDLKQLKENLKISAPAGTFTDADLAELTKDDFSELKSEAAYNYLTKFEPSLLEHNAVDIATIDNLPFKIRGMLDHVNKPTTGMFAFDQTDVGQQSFRIELFSALGEKGLARLRADAKDNMQTQFHNRLQNNSEHPAMKSFSEQAQANIKKPNFLELLKELFKKLMDRLNFKKAAKFFDSLDDGKTLEMANFALQAQANSQATESKERQTAPSSRWSFAKDLEVTEPTPTPERGGIRGPGL